jgi:chromosome partitioning protein
MALRGLWRLFEIVADVQGVTNPGLQYLGIVTTRYDSRTLNSREVHEYLQTLSDEQDIRLFNAVVKERVRVKESPNAGVPIVITHPDLDSSMAYRQVAKEIVYGK